jgi:hypothetical protein
MIAILLMSVAFLYFLAYSLFAINPRDDEIH